MLFALIRYWIQLALIINYMNWKLSIERFERLYSEKIQIEKLTFRMENFREILITETWFLP